MSRISDVLRRSEQRLNHRLEAELLLAHALARPRTWLYAHGNDPLPPGAADQLEKLLQRRLAGEPMAYILGVREFYGREFAVAPAVLIPRPETELIVDLALQRLPSDPCRVVDVGTGSGCIALTLAAERPDWHVTALDLSAEALAVCGDNAGRLGLERVRLCESDLLGAVAGERFDAIVSNPPYVAEDDPHLNQGDLRFEPGCALSAGDHGLAVIKRLISQACMALEPAGWLIIEHGHDQGPAVAERMTASGLSRIATQRDLAGIERVTLAQR
ncbi:MAG: peptide chain release factor N(5)-glutamine methyltransferase [Wenzhouxiangella sp.]